MAFNLQLVDSTDSAMGAASFASYSLHTRLREFHIIPVPRIKHPNNLSWWGLNGALDGAYRTGSRLGKDESAPSPVSAAPPCLAAAAGGRAHSNELNPMAEGHMQPALPPKKPVQAVRISRKEKAA